MNDPVSIPYEQWVDNVIAFCLDEGLEYSFDDQTFKKTDTIDVSNSAYERQKKRDIQRWHESVTK